MLFSNILLLLCLLAKLIRLRQDTIAKTGNCTCPFKVLTAYLQKGHMFNLSERYIFRKLVFRKKSDEYVFKDEGKMSYTRCRELLKEKIIYSWGGCEEILWISGGATEAAASGVSDRLFKKHGRWKSETAKDGYVRESISEKLSVTQNLGI